MLNARYVLHDGENYIHVDDATAVLDRYADLVSTKAYAMVDDPENVNAAQAPMIEMADRIRQLAEAIRTGANVEPL